MSDHVDKMRRHRLILEILRSSPIGSQEELAGALEGRDVVVTQPTLSRDLHELRVTRVPTDIGYQYVPPELGNGGHRPTPQRLQRLAALEVTGVEANDVVVAVHTMPGRAQGLAAYLDNLEIPELMATIAGDDTVIAHPRRTRQTAKLRRTLTELLSIA